MSQDHIHLNHATHATWECNTMSCSRRSTTRNCYFEKSDATWALYFHDLTRRRNAELKRSIRYLCAKCRT